MRVKDQHSAGMLLCANSRWCDSLCLCDCSDCPLYDLMWEYVGGRDEIAIEFKPQSDQALDEDVTSERSNRIESNRLAQ